MILNTLCYLFADREVADKEYNDDEDYQSFRRQLFHSTLHEIFYPMHEAMEKPVVKLCADGHYRRIIFGLGPHIADYPEQVVIACIVYMWCPKYATVQSISRLLNILQMHR
jgi:hypothetical protein